MTTPRRLNVAFSSSNSALFWLGVLFLLFYGTELRCSLGSRAACELADLRQQDALAAARAERAGPAPGLPAGGAK